MPREGLDRTSVRLVRQVFMFWAEGMRGSAIDLVHLGD